MPIHSPSRSIIVAIHVLHSIPASPYNSNLADAPHFHKPFSRTTAIVSHLLRCSGGLARRRSSTGELWAEPTGSGLGRMWPSRPSCVCACTYGTVLCWTRQRRKSLNYSHLLLQPHLLSILPHPPLRSPSCGDDFIDRSSQLVIRANNFPQKILRRGILNSFD